LIIPSVFQVTKRFGGDLAHHLTDRVPDASDMFDITDTPNVSDVPNIPDITDIPNVLDTPNAPNVLNVPKHQMHLKRQ